VHVLTFTDRQYERVSSDSRASAAKDRARIPTSLPCSDFVWGNMLTGCFNFLFVDNRISRHPA